MTNRLTIDVPPTRLLRPLPRPVRPVRDEPLHAFVNRLAAANRLDAAELRIYLAEGDTRARVRIPLERLAILSGQPQATLRRTIGEYWSPAERLRPVPPPAGNPERIACRLCSARRGITGTVRVRLQLDDLICQSHHRWLGDSVLDPLQPTLTGHPEIYAANRRHRRLVRRRGRLAADNAFGEAQRICAAWQRRFEHDDEFHRLLRRFHPRGGQVLEADPTVEACAYPQVVALAVILASPSLRELPLHDAGVDAFIAEIRRTVAAAFTWNLSSSGGRCDPLVELLIDERYARHEGLPPRSAIFATPQRPLESLGRESPHARPRCWAVRR